MDKKIGEGQNAIDEAEGGPLCFLYTSMSVWTMIYAILSWVIWQIPCLKGMALSAARPIAHGRSKKGAACKGEVESGLAP